MLTSWYLNEKSREVCIRARSTPTLLVFTIIHVGQVTKQQLQNGLFFPVTFTLSGKNLVIQSQLNRTEQKSDESGLFLQQKSLFAFTSTFEQLYSYKRLKTNLQHNVYRSFSNI